MNGSIPPKRNAHHYIRQQWGRPWPIAFQRQDSFAKTAAPWVYLWYIFETIRIPGGIMTTITAKLLFHRKGAEDAKRSNCRESLRALPLCGELKSFS
jgi:hypothetical protein